MGKVKKRSAGIFWRLVPVLLVPGLLAVMGCGGDGISLKKVSDGLYRFQGPGVTFEVNERMIYRVLKRGRGGKVTIVDAGNVPEPDVPIVWGREVTGFRLTGEVSGPEAVSTEYGPGERIELVGAARSSDGTDLEKRLEIILLNDHPDAVLFRTKYRNPGDSPVTIEGYRCNNLILDRSLAEGSAAKHDFWAFQGIGILEDQPGYTRWTNVFPLKPGYDQGNDNSRWSGTPVVDVWGAETGLAVACVEPRSRVLSMPVKVLDDGRVSVAISRNIPETIPPRGTIETIQTAVIVHDLDYFHGLKKFAGLMKHHGFEPKQSPDFGYDPFWCDWGYRKDWTVAHHFERIPLLKELGISAEVIDDGWFIAYGDWGVSRRKFKGGEAEFKRMIDRLHAEGMKVILWWVPGIAGPQLAKEHPNWLVKDENNEPVASNWRGSYFLCPTEPQVRDYTRELVRKWVDEWGVDGFKMDGVYTCPLCSNRVQRHRPPESAPEAYEDIFRVIYEEVQELRPEGDFVLGFCPCGHFSNFWCLNWINRPVTADPPGRNRTMRYRIRAYKALLGPTAAVDNDFHETYNDYFPAEMAAGGFPSTKFTELSDFELAEFRKWYGIYAETRLSEGEYLGLYDIAYDEPETYVIKRDGAVYYALFTDLAIGPTGVPWDIKSVAEREKRLKEQAALLAGSPATEFDVELRGLEAGTTYRIVDYENDREIVTARAPIILEGVEIVDHLLLRAEPVE
ncbi:alpha-galactosidase [candidate division KSB1 bacterium]